MPEILEEKVALATDYWKVYQAGDVDTNSITRTVDHYLAHILSPKGNLSRVNSSILFFRSFPL